MSSLRASKGLVLVPGEPSRPRTTLSRLLRQDEEHWWWYGWSDETIPGFMLQQMMNTSYPGQQHGNMDHMARMASGMGQRMHHPNMMRPMMGGHPGHLCHGYPTNMSTANSVMPPNISPVSTNSLLQDATRPGSRDDGQGGTARDHGPGAGRQADDGGLQRQLPPPVRWRWCPPGPSCQATTSSSRPSQLMGH